MGLDVTEARPALKTFKISRMLVFRQVPCWVSWSQSFRILIHDTDGRFSGPECLRELEHRAGTGIFSHVHSCAITIRSVFLVV